MTYGRSSVVDTQSRPRPEWHIVRDGLFHADAVRPLPFLNLGMDRHRADSSLTQGLAVYPESGTWPGTRLTFFNEIDTPKRAISLLRGGNYRIDVDPDRPEHPRFTVRGRRSGSHSRPGAAVSCCMPRESRRIVTGHSDFANTETRAAGPPISFGRVVLWPRSARKTTVPGGPGTFRAES